MVPQKGGWGAGPESAGQRASFTTRATAPPRARPPQSPGLCPPRGWAAGHLRSGAAPPRSAVVTAPLRAAFAATKATSDNSACCAPSPHQPTPVGAQSRERALGSGTRPRAGGGGGRPPAREPRAIWSAAPESLPLQRPPPRPQPRPLSSPLPYPRAAPDRPESLNSGREPQAFFAYGTSSRKSPAAPVPVKARPRARSP